MKRTKRNQLELRTVGQEFNLVSETGPDPVRVMLDKLHAAEAQAAAREYELCMQRVFADCPGFQSGDAPKGEQSRGWLVVEASWIGKAMPWLKRRFQVADTVEVDQANNGLRIEIAPKPKRVRGPKKQKPVPVNFSPIVQYELPL